MLLSQDEQLAVALYAIADRDIEAFIDDLPGTPLTALQILYEMLVTPNDSMSLQNQELNVLLAPIIERAIKDRT